MSENPLLARIRMPGETYRLPSGGLFYEKGVLADNVVDGELHVHPMTTIDEITLKTPDLLYSGKAVEQVFARCVPGVLQVSKLLAKDVDFLLICLRKVSYGPQMELTYMHTCTGAKEHTYMVGVDTFLKKSKRIDPSTITSDFTVTLANGQIVKLEPISFQDYVVLMQSSETEADIEKQAKRLCFTVSRIIKSVDNTVDKDNIQEWLAKIAPMLMKEITEAIEKTTQWGPDFMAPITCKECKEEVMVQAPLNPLAFFT